MVILPTASRWSIYTAQKKTVRTKEGKIEERRTHVKIEERRTHVKKKGGKEVGAYAIAARGTRCLSPSTSALKLVVGTNPLLLCKLVFYWRLVGG